MSTLASLIVACAAPGDSDTAPQGEPEDSIPQLVPDGDDSTALDQDKDVGSQSAAPAPTITPATAIQEISINGIYNCPPGNFCAIVRNPVTGGWRVFKLFTCTTYSLHDWIGPGFYFDNQTGNPGTIVYDRNKRPLNPPGTIFPGGGQQPIDWTPAWFIKNC